MKNAFVLLLAFSLLAIAVHGEKATQLARVIKEPAHFYTGETFLDLSENERMIYSSGVLDGFFASGMFRADDETVSVLQTCTHEMDARQVSAIFTKYVKDNPDQWHLPFTVLAVGALVRACPRLAPAPK
jgi:hypothetical protein